jgi:hypothetical protein
MIDCYGKVFDYPHKTAADKGCYQQGKPYDRNDTANRNDEARFLVVIAPHYTCKA